jgi:hypothetical protein
MMQKSSTIIALIMLAATAHEATAQRRLDPSVLTLLKTTASSDFKHESVFFRTLRQLARRNGYAADVLTNYDSGEKPEGGRARAMLMNGRAAILVSGERQYVAVILGTDFISVPGVEAQKILLLDTTGKITDQISCEINSRYGRLTTEFLQTPQDDEATISIQFVSCCPAYAPWHNWHTINYEGKPYTFWALGNRDPEELTRKGLVRLAVQDGKFNVIFPELRASKLSTKPRMAHARELIRKGQTYPSPDGTLHANIRQKSDSCDELRVEIRNAHGTLLLSKSFFSPDCEHGMGIEHAAWTGDSRFFVFNAQSMGGHQPWHWPVYFYSRLDGKLHNLDIYTGPIVAPDFSLSGKHVVETRVLTIEGEEGKPITVNLERIGKRIPRKVHKT